MLELRLHGALGRDFGTVWEFDVKTVREAINAICSQRPGFRAAVMKLDKTGMVFRVRNREQDLVEEDLPLQLGDSCQVDIIPIMRGASAGVRFIVGAILVVAGAVVNYYSVGTASPYGMAMISMGISMMVGSVAEMLAPHPKREQYKDDTKSWLINGPVSTADQGVPVPVVYGEVLTSGVPISAGITTARGIDNPSQVPVASIGGDISDVFRFGGAINGAHIVLYYSVSTLYLSEPFTYAWTVTGFSGATQIVKTGTDTATLMLTLTYTQAENLVNSQAGTVQVQVNGTDVNGHATHVTTNASALIYIDTRVPDWG